MSRMFVGQLGPTDRGMEVPDHPEAREYSEHQAELEQLAGNEKECEECGGSGRAMTMVCYGGPPHETEVDCEACRGRGVVSA